MQTNLRTLILLGLALCAGSVAVSTGFTVATLAFQEVSGSLELSGIGLAIGTLGSVLGSWVVQKATNIWGRSAVSIGFIIAALGSFGTALAIYLRNPLLLLVASVIFGFAAASNLRLRFTSADMVDHDKQSLVASLFVALSVIGSVLGPQISVWSAKLFNIPLADLFSPYIVSGFVLFLSAGFILSSKLPKAETSFGNVIAHTKISGLQTRWVLHLQLAVGISHGVMLGLMSMTPITLQKSHHDLADIGLVMSVHLFAMYGLAPFIGWWVSRWCPWKVSQLGLVVSFTSCLLTIFGWNIYFVVVISLFFLGLGWSMTMVAGTSLQVQQIAREFQTKGDMILNLFGTIFIAVSGFALTIFTVPGSSLLLAIICLTGVFLLHISRRLFNFSRSLY